MTVLYIGQRPDHHVGASRPTMSGERFTNSPAKIAVAVVAFAVMAAGLTALTRTAPRDVTPAGVPVDRP